jgi:hypothetical protein
VGAGPRPGVGTANDGDYIGTDHHGGTGHYHGGTDHYHLESNYNHRGAHHDNRAAGNHDYSTTDQLRRR